jgi:hypothetical protein
LLHCRLPIRLPPLYRCTAERLRQEIESARDGIIARAAELAGLTSELGQQQQAASAAVAAAAAALAAREEEVEAAAQRLRMLQAQQQQAREALAAAQEAREQGAQQRLFVYMLCLGLYIAKEVLACKSVPWLNPLCCCVVQHQLEFDVDSKAPLRIEG